MGAVVSAATAVVGVLQGERSRRQAKKAADIDRRIQELQQRREKQRVLREAQVARAGLAQQAATSGVQDTSSAQLGIASIQTQAAENIGFLQRVGTLQQQSARRLQAAADAGARAQTASQLASVFSQISGSGGAGPASGGG